jgi:hypothetical protein
MFRLRARGNWYRLVMSLCDSREAMERPSPPAPRFPLSRKRERVASALWSSPLWRLFLAVPLFLVLVFPARGQTPNGTLQGLVMDPSGAVIPGAAVTVINSETKVSRNVVTDPQGRFFVPYLIPGPYNVSVSARGFQSVEETGVVILVSRIRSLNITLTVGRVSQTVEVSASAAALQTTTGTLGAVVDNSMIMDLPTQGRDPLTMVELVPTVTVGIALSNTTTPMIGGSRNAVNEEQINGISVIVPNDNVGTTNFSYTPIIDSVQEFSVDYNSLAAEYGRFGGGVINLVTKPGTNQIHGDLFEFLQNSALNANDFFNNRAGVAYSYGFNPTTELGMPSYVTTQAATQALQFPYFAFEGASNMGTNADYLATYPSSYIGMANLTKATGHHTFKFGWEYRKLFLNYAQYGYPDGYYDFTDTPTQFNPLAANGAFWQLGFHHRE